VPDGDTGTNLHLTVLAAAESVAELPEEAALPEVWRALGRGALTGARGNSGVIVSQFLRGLAEILGSGGRPDGLLLEEALAYAAELARAAVAHPVEGTVLTVLRAASEAAGGGTAAEVARSAARGARRALRETTGQLDVLAERGVVDAGAAGLCVLLDALAAVVTQEYPERYEVPARDETKGAAAVRPAEKDFGYEVIYLLEAEDERIPALRTALDALGDSLVVVGGDGLWNVHVHVDDVGAAIEAGIAAGSPFRISVIHFADQVAGRAPVRSGRAIISAVTGPGLAELTEKAGAVAVPFGPDDELTVARVAEAIAAAHADEVICLPNRAGHIPMFEAAAASARDAGARVAVLPTTVQVQALTALAVHDPGRPFDVVVVAMSNAAGATRHGAVTIAAEDGITMAGPCRAGDVLGVVNGDFAIVGSAQEDVAFEVLQRLDLPTAEIVTLVVGRDCREGTPELICERLRHEAPHVDVEVLEGDQETYPLFLAVE